MVTVMDAHNTERDLAANRRISSPHDATPDWSALAAVNSRGGVTVSNPNVRIKRLSDDPLANRIARK
jgi:hypothetical protein